MATTPRRKLYCYVDETGQDTSSKFFVVVAVVSDAEQEKLRQELLEVERAAGTGNRKWHKSRPERRLQYLFSVMQRGLGVGEVFFGSYPKPLPYFFPFLEVLEFAIKSVAGEGEYTTKVFVDGIDRNKARELTNALRLRGVSLEMVQSRRDESEPIIRLADMWAGCIRAAQLGFASEERIVSKARRMRILRDIKENTP